MPAWPADKAAQTHQRAPTTHQQPPAATGLTQPVALTTLQQVDQRSSSAGVGSAIGGSGPFLTCGTRGQLELCSCGRCVDAADHGMQAGSQSIYFKKDQASTSLSSTSSSLDRYNQGNKLRISKVSRMPKSESTVKNLSHQSVAHV